MATTSNAPKIGENDVLFRCRFCGKSLVIDQRAIGLDVNCPDCRKLITVPDKETAAREYDELAKLRSHPPSPDGEPTPKGPPPDATARQPEPPELQEREDDGEAPASRPDASSPPPTDLQEAASVEAPAKEEPAKAEAPELEPTGPETAPAEDGDDEVRVGSEHLESAAPPASAAVAAPPPRRSARAPLAASAVSGLPPAEVLQEALNAAHRRISVLAKSLLEMKQRRRRLESFRARTLVSVETIHEEIQVIRDSLDRLVEALESTLKDPPQNDGGI